MATCVYCGGSLGLGQGGHVCRDWLDLSEFDKGPVRFHPGLGVKDDDRKEDEPSFEWTEQDREDARLAREGEKSDWRDGLEPWARD